MADNVSANAIPTATRNVTYSGDAGQNVQAVGLVVFTGSDDAKTAIDLPGDATNGLDVDVTRLPAVALTSDTGRTYVTLHAELITGVTTEALASFTKNVNGTETTAQTAYTITSGKTFRIQSVSVIIKNTTTVANNMQVRVRVAASVSATSPIVANVAAAAVAAVATVIGTAYCDFPGGIDVLGDGSKQIGISHLENVTTASIASLCVVGYEFTA